MINDHGELEVADNLKRQWLGGLFWFQRLPAIDAKSKLFLIVLQILTTEIHGRELLN